MRRQKRGMAWGAAAVVAALAVGACARDASAPGAGVPTDLGPPGAALADGAIVRAQVRDEAVLPGAAPGESGHELDAAAREAVVVGGAARDVASGVLLAVVPGRERGRRDLRHDDDEGHGHRLVVDGQADDGGPPATVRYERDGQVVAQVDYRWERRDGGYVLRERTLTLEAHGRVLLRVVRRIDGVAILAGLPTAGAPGAGDAAAPAVLQVQAMPCVREWGIYVGASAAMLVAGEVFTILPNTATGAALLAAVKAWESSLDRLLACQLNSVAAP